MSSKSSSPVVAAALSVDAAEKCGRDADRVESGVGAND